jgi:polysaccharide export outer membrane protein
MPMTINPTCIVRTLVLAGLALSPSGLVAQTRTAPPAPAPATTPRSGAGTTIPAPRGTAGTTAAPASTAARAPATAGRPWNDQDYKLGPGDKLRIEVYREPQMSQALQVRPDGKITLPLVGDVAAAGRTPIELRDSISSSLKEYLANPVVTVIVQEAVAAQVYVIGEVSQSGTQVMQGPLTALQALAQAGGLKEFAKKSDIHILRGTQKVPFDYKDAVNGRIAPVYLQPGDTIVVP